MLVAVSYLVCALVWGTTWFAIRVCIAEGGYPSLAGAALRFSVAAALLSLIVYVFKLGARVRSRRQQLWLCTAGLLNGANYALVYVGEETVPGGLAAVLFGTLPLMTGIIALWTRTERVTPAHIVGAVISLVGVAVVFWDGMQVSEQQAFGILLIMGGVLVSTLYSVVLKRETAQIHPLRATSWFLWVTTFFLWATAAIAGETSVPWPPPLRPTLALLYLAIFGSVFTFACYLYLLQRVTLMTTTTLVFIQPLIALVVDALWEEGGGIGPRGLFGAGLTLLGVFVTVSFKEWSRRRRLRPPPLQAA